MLASIDLSGWDFGFMCQAAFGEEICKVVESAERYIGTLRDYTKSEYGWCVYELAEGKFLACPCIAIRLPDDWPSVGKVRAEPFYGPPSRSVTRRKTARALCSETIDEVVGMFADGDEGFTWFDCRLIESIELLKPIRWELTSQPGKPVLAFDANDRLIGMVAACLVVTMDIPNEAA
jgi:hypothetical protein